MARATSQNATAAGASERQPLDPPQGLAAARERDRLLVALTFSSGAVDAISYVVLGKVFTAFMTGNLVFLALDLTGSGEQHVRPVLVSLGAFSGGVALARRTIGDLDGSEVWPAVVSGVLRLAVLAQAGFLLVWVVTSGHPTGGAVDVLIALSATAMGLQSGAARALGVAGVFTTAATATVIGLMTDLAARTRSSDTARLAMVLVGLLAGAAAGGLLLTRLHAYAAVLPLAVTLLVVARASSGDVR